MATPAKQTEALIFPTKLGKQAQDAVIVAKDILAVASTTEKELAEIAIKNGKSVRKAIEEVRFSFTRPLDEQKAAVMQLEKALAGGLDAEITRLTNLVNAFIKAEYRKAEEEKLRIQQEEETRLKRLRSPVSIAKVQAETETRLAEVAPETKGTMMKTLYEVVNINQVPRELMMVDEARVKQALKEGRRNIGGLKIWDEPVRSGR